MVHAMDVLYRKRCATQEEGMPLHPCSDVRHDFCSVNVYVKKDFHLLPRASAL